MGELKHTAVVGGPLDSAKTWQSCDVSQARDVDRADVGGEGVLQSSGVRPSSDVSHARIHMPGERYATAEVGFGFDMSFSFFSPC